MSAEDSGRAGWHLKGGTGWHLKGGTGWHFDSGTWWHLDVMSASQQWHPKVVGKQDWIAPLVTKPPLDKSTPLLNPLLYSVQGTVYSVQGTVIVYATYADPSTTP